MAFYIQMLSFQHVNLETRSFIWGDIFVVIGIMGSAAEQRHKTSFLLDQVMTRKHLYPRKQLKNRTPGSMLHSCTKGHGT